MSYIGKYKPDPDFQRLLTVFRREGEPDRIPFLELFADLEIMEDVLEKPIPRFGRLESQGVNREMEARYCDAHIEFYHSLGYDYVRAVTRGGDLQFGHIQLDDTAKLSKGKRSWIRGSGGLVTNWTQYEAYPWPDSRDIDYWMLEYLSGHLPDGMKLLAHSGSILESVMWLMGYETLAMNLYDQPDLLEVMFERVGQMYMDRCHALSQFDAIGAIWINDDIGHRSGTMIAPDHLRHYVFPWWKRIAECIHAQGRPVLLHSCGKLELVMDEIIDDIGVDAKHSFEDTILPVTEAKKLYGNRVALLGGVDIDYICRHSEEEIRQYVRNVIDVCGPGGSYALGTGNSVANYIPVPNYLAMLDEGRRYGVYS